MPLVVLATTCCAPTALVDVTLDDPSLSKRRAKFLLQLDRRLVRLALRVGKQVAPRELVKGVFNKRPQSAGNWQTALLTRLGFCPAV